MSSTQPIITDIYFVPMKQVGTFVGFVSFRYSDFAVKGIAVHESSQGGFYLVYPEEEKFADDGSLIRKSRFMYPIKEETDKLVEVAVNEYLKTNWDRDAKVVRNQRKTPKKVLYGKSISSKKVEGAERRTTEEGSQGSCEGS